MLLPIEGEKLLHGSFPSSTAAQGMCMSLFWGGLRIITDPIQGLPAGLTNGTDKGGRKKNKVQGGNGSVVRFAAAAKSLQGKKKSIHFPIRFHVVKSFISRFFPAVVKRKHFSSHFAGVLEER